MVDADLRVLHCNRRIGELSRGTITAERIIGMRLEEAFPFLAESGALKEYRRVLATGECLTTSELTVFHGETIATRTHKKPLRGGNGAVERVLTVIDDVSREHRLAEELRLKNLELEAVNQDLNSFVSMTSHELRSPLSDIEGFAGLLGERLDELPKADVRDFVNRIATNAGRLHLLIDDLLLFAREKKRPLEPEKLRLRPLLDDLVVQFGDLIRSTAARVTLNLGVEEMVSDRLKLGQILKNLLENALIYRREEAPPSILVETLPGDGEDVVIRVNDNGRGIEPGEQKAVFDIFYRGVSARGRRGTGIGLALVRENAKRLGGAVLLESVPGEGSAFTVILPREGLRGAGRP